LLEREADVFSTTPGTAKDKVTKGHIAIWLSIGGPYCAFSLLPRPLRSNGLECGLKWQSSTVRATPVSFPFFPLPLFFLFFFFLPFYCTPVSALARRARAAQVPS
jgi:hypothetical protein